jgi:hypothetical protein
MNNKTLSIEIPIQELKNYQKGILGVLSKVKVDDLDSSSIEDVKSVYRLLDQLRSNDNQPQNINSKQLLA